MNVGELITKLSRLNPDMPVLMQQHDEPLGDYEVLDVTVTPGHPDKLFHRTAPTYGGRTWDCPQVWHTHESHATSTDVVLLGSETPWQPTIEGAIAPREITQHADPDQPH